MGKISGDVTGGGTRRGARALRAAGGDTGTPRAVAVGQARADAAAAIDAVNEVVLVGRLAAAVEDREMPSGDVLTMFRVVVDRPPRKLPDGVRPTTIDTLDCVVWSSRVRRSVGTWRAGDVVRVEGALRRRFWQGPTGASSRYEVEVGKATRLARAG